MILYRKRQKTDMNKQIAGSFIVLVLAILIMPSLVSAVVPPDFIFNVGTQVVQFFSLIAVFFAAFFSALFHLFKVKFFAIKKKGAVLAATFAVAAVFVTAGYYFYVDYAQKAEYQKWLAESIKFNSSSGNMDINTEKGDSRGISNSINPAELPPPLVDENDKLAIGSKENQDIDISEEKFVSKIELADETSRFINEYYKNIAEKNFEQAYEMSKKTADFETFKGWYANTDKITLDNLVRIDDRRSSIELTLYEKGTVTRYGTLMILAMREGKPVGVDWSQARVLAAGVVENGNVVLDEKKISEQYDFFSANEKRSIVVTNQEFKSITQSGRDDYLVLDAREDTEYESGYFPGSVHVRFADLKSGRWIEMPKDKLIYVICWSGIRGREVAEFLRTKKIAAAFLEKGADGWVSDGGQWIGTVKFSEKFGDPKFRRVFDTQEVKNKVNEGAVLVDSREPLKFKQWHIAGSYSIPIMYTPTIELEAVFSQVALGSSIITVCDGYVNCFDAKITGIEMERRGYQFLGRYNKPWEYEK